MANKESVDELIDGHINLSTKMLKTVLGFLEADRPDSAKSYTKNCIKILEELKFKPRFKN